MWQAREQTALDEYDAITVGCRQHVACCRCLRSLRAAPLSKSLHRACTLIQLLLRLSLSISVASGPPCALLRVIPLQQ